jgi:uncharacterized protein YjeT (DUF2065 family)
MWSALALAFGLMLVIEGILPFVAPARWREILTKVAGLPDGQIRFFGLSIMLVGLFVVLASR